MNRWKSILVLTLSAVVFWACEPGTDDDVAQEPQGSPAVIMFEGAFFVEGDVDAESGTLTDSDRTTLDLAQAVRAFDETATWEYQGSTLEMVRVEYDDRTGYVFSDYVAMDAVPAALTQEARVFSEGRDAGVTTRNLPPVQLVALHDESFEDDLRQITFTPLMPNDAYGRNRIYTVWVKLDTLTQSENDVKVAYLYYLATRADDPETEVARLEVALDTPSVFSDEVRARLNEIQGGDGTSTEGDAASETQTQADGIPEDYEISNEMQGTQATLNVRSNIRSEPRRSSESLGILEPGTEVTLEFRTVESETIRDLTDHWYLVTVEQPDGTVFEGWVFGALLDPVAETE